MNAITFKRTRDDKNPSYMWHIRLGLISDDEICMLVHSGQLGPWAYEAHPTFESCLMGKMTKTPFVGQSERAAYIKINT